MNHTQGVKIFFSAGEPSGDLHGANLIRALRDRCDNLQAVGYGGPNMAKAGCSLHADLTALAVMFILRALLNIHKFARLLYEADRYFAHHRPDAVVLIDFPGFNWWIARRAKKHGIPVFYYAPPQVWAWGRWRVKKMQRFVDHVLCALPFEQKWFSQHDCNATFVGHPFFDEVHDHPLDGDVLAQQRQQGGPLVAILPGSRTQEVTHNLHWLVKAAKLVHADVPEARFVIAAFKQQHAEMAQQAVSEANLPVTIHVGKTPELIASAKCCMAVSGSVSLELLHHQKPTVILYWISRSVFSLQKFIRKVKYITLVNLLAAENAFDGDIALFDPHQKDADKVPFPEYLTCEDKSAQMARHVIDWLQDETELSRRVQQLGELKQQVCHSGASATAAQYVLDALGKSTHIDRPQPHITAGSTLARVPQVPQRREDSEAAEQIQEDPYRDAA